MNNKSIIIDGVNVAGCEFFEPKAQVMQCHMRALTQRCKENNCYYKQLQRAKKEKWQLTEDLTALQQTYEACEKEYNALTKRYHALQGVLNANKKRI